MWHLYEQMYKNRTGVNWSSVLSDEELYLIVWAISHKVCILIGIFKAGVSLVEEVKQDKMLVLYQK